MLTKPQAPHTPRILICDDDPLFAMSVRHVLRDRFQVQSARNGDEALAILRNHSVDLVLLDVEMRTNDEGLQYLTRFRELQPEVVVVMSSGRTDFETVRGALRRGADDYVAKNFENAELEITIERALEKGRLRNQSRRKDFEVQAATRRHHPMIGSGAAMSRLRGTLPRFQSSSANVLITGETGTGKEVVARQLRGKRDDGTLAPFVAIDSSTIQSTMAESILFGHEKGAFTGADRAMRGIFEEADGGIVYFDEIANMPLEIQAKLLRVLQEKEVLRLGSSRPIPLEFRVVAATNRDLDELAAQGRFKDDLLQRLQVLPIEIPPLRDRIEDIPALAEHFLRSFRIDSPGFDPAALSALQAYRWPGNVRELSNVVAYAGTMAEPGADLGIEVLPARLTRGPNANPSRGLVAGAVLRAAERGPAEAQASGSDTQRSSFYEEMGRIERELLSAKYAAFGGNVSRMAAELSMDRSHLHAKLKAHGIKS